MIRHVIITSLTAAIHNNSAPCVFNVRCSSENLPEFETSCETMARYSRRPSQSYLTVKTYAVRCTLLIKPTGQTLNAINSIRHDASSLAVSLCHVSSGGTRPCAQYHPYMCSKIARLFFHRRATSRPSRSPCRYTTFSACPAVHSLYLPG